MRFAEDRETVSLDPITLEVLRHRFDAIADNMESTLVKCASSPSVKEGADCSVALFDTSGDTVAQGLAIPVHLGSMPPAVKSMLARYPARSLKEGDMLVMNDPYGGGQHNPDIIVLVPWSMVARRWPWLWRWLTIRTSVGGRRAPIRPMRRTSSRRACASRRSSSSRTAGCPASSRPS